MQLTGDLLQHVPSLNRTQVLGLPDPPVAVVHQRRMPRQGLSEQLNMIRRQNPHRL